jgi:hypothetical protein
MGANNEDYVKPSSLLYENDTEESLIAAKESKVKERKIELVWSNILSLLFLHINSVYGIYLLATGQVMWKTILFGA